MVTKTNAPLPADIVEGEKYYWCSCGLSQNMPLCDESHQQTDKEPVEFIASDTTTTWLCGCTRTKRPPFCDGSHCKV